MRAARTHLPAPVCALLLLLAHPVNVSADAPADSVRTLVDNLVGRMRTNSARGIGFDTTLMLSDSIETLARARFGESDTAVATAEAFKGLAFIHLGRDANADSCLCRAIRIWQTNQGTDCPQQAAVMRLLGDLYAYQHRDVESENTYRKALEILDNAPPYKGYWTTRWMQALLTNNLGLLYASQGRYREAIESYQVALRLWSEESGADSPDACTARLNLGAAARDLGDFATAEQHVRYALGVYERAQNNGSLLGDQGNGTRLILALICIHQRKADEAVSLVNRALAGFAQKFGNMSRGMLPALEVAKVVESDLGHWAKAAEHAEHGIRIIEQTDSRNAADLSHYVLDLAGFLYPMGKLDESEAAFDRADSLRRSFMRGAFSYASEKSKLLYIRQFPLIDNAHLSFALQTRRPSAVTSAFQAVLSGKGSVLDALSEERRIAVCSATPEMASQTERFSRVCNAIAELAVSSSGDAFFTRSPEASSLYREKDSLELALSRECAEFDNLLRMPAVSVADVSKNLPPNSVLWEYLLYRPYCFSYQDSVLPLRYLVLTLDNQGHTGVTDLGEARVIDSLVELVHQDVQSGADLFMGENEHHLESELNRVSSALANLIFFPLLKDAQDNEHIFISPDGQLSLLPFEILPLSDGRYAIEQYEFSYLSSGRDLLRFQTTPRSEASGAVVIAAPDYESTQPGVYAQVPVHLDRLDANRFRGPSDRTECLAVPFNPLPSSAAEGRTVADMLSGKFGSDVHYLSGPEASEGALKHLNHPPRILHIATHGYFCLKARYSDVSGLTESPLLYSGLALAGSNRVIRKTESDPGVQEDGILTALEASSLDLVGTDLVVLGACRTGAGTVLQGEGVYGLRRAFQLAGARSIVMSMFDLPDKTATDLMTRFYGSWLSGAAKSTALRTAELSVLKERRQTRGAAHPLFWGGLVLTGDYR